MERLCGERKRKLSKNGLMEDLQNNIKKHFSFYLTADLKAIADIIQDSKITLEFYRKFVFQQLNNKSLLLSEEKRIVFIKLLIALMPTSIDLIKKILDDKSSDINFELQFTVFCYLDQMIALPNVTRKERKEVLNLVESYLLSINTEKCDSAWMAGDMLGAHWQLGESYELLIKIIQNARYVAGKKAAAYGLYQAALRGKKEQVKKIMKNLVTDEQQKISFKKYILFLLKKL